jgi:hypothetical protein
MHLKLLENQELAKSKISSRQKEIIRSGQKLMKWRLKE